MKKIYFILVLFIMSFLNNYAQQDPHYTQYMYNMNVINPAYAGSKEALSGSVLYRQQWTGVTGAPQTGTFSLHSPFGKNVGLGLSAISDKIGPIEENNIYIDFSYTVNLSPTQKLSFGLKTGATFNKIGLFSEIGNGYVQQLGDIAFSENTNSTYLNVGTGLFYYAEKHYLAFSVPNMLKATYLNVTRNGQDYNFGTKIQHYFLTGGYVFDLSSNTKFKPSFMMKSAFNAPLSLDVSSNLLFFEKFEAGITYRLNDSFGVVANYAISKGLRIGYAYDHVVSELKTAAPASHEFILLFDLNYSKKVSISPRFF